MALEYPPAPVPETIEGRCFQAAIDLLEGHFHDRPSMGPLTSAKVVGILTRTAEKTSAVKEVRCVFLCFPELSQGRTSDL